MQQDKPVKNHWFFCGKVTIQPKKTNKKTVPLEEISIISNEPYNPIII